jgi:hypothetical protein
VLKPLTSTDSKRLCRSTLRKASGFPAPLLFLNRGYASAARRSLAVNFKRHAHGQAKPDRHVRRQSRKALHLSRFPIYYSTAMAKSKPKSKANRDSNQHVSREYVYSLRGKLKGKGLLKALLAEKKKDQRA